MPTPLLFRAVVLLLVTRLALRRWPFATVQRRLARLARIGVRRPSARPSAEAICRAVIHAGRFVRNSTCLTRAMAAQALLVDHGYPADLHLGVARSATRPLIAHAWLESGAHIVIGGEVSQAFAQLTGSTRLG